MAAKDKIKEAWNENPIGVAIVAGALMTAAAKLIDSLSSISSKRAYSRHSKIRGRK